MTLSIYNTLTRTKEIFTPIDPDGRRVTIYNCGPTVYDRFHVGNARNFVVMDVVRRYLARSYEVRFVQNLTDVDDKIIARAQREEVSFDEIRTTYTAAYFEDAGKLRVRRADVHPSATEFIGPMVELIGRLESEGLAYAANGDVYFRVRKFDEYGKLSGRQVDDMRSGSRVDVNEQKEDPLDFALWKTAKPGEPSWPSPWGPGRPGWHIECSAMAMGLLGETIDIHSGGSDLVFPHHENEIAQSEGATHKPFARFWMHNGFLNIDGEKMAKSAGNFLRIDQVLERHTVETVRFFLMSAHYRHPLDYNEEALQEAGAAVRRINEGLETGEKLLALVPAPSPSNPSILSSSSTPSIPPLAAEFREKFEAVMDDDFNTPRALAVLHDIVTVIHDTLRRKPLDAPRLDAAIKIGRELRDFFALEPNLNPAVETEITRAVADLEAEVERQASEAGIEKVNHEGPPGGGGSGAETGIEPIDAVLARLIEYRKRARKNKAFALADLIRTRLADSGVSLEDHPQGTIWKLTRR